MRRHSAFLAVIAVVVSLLTVVPPHAALATSLAGTGLGYWEAQTDGGVFAAGSAANLGGVNHPAAPIVGITAQPGGTGYVLAGADGGVYAFGSAKFLGSMRGTPLTKRVVGVAYTPTGNGYYLVAADGGIFTFGDAVFRGSTGAIALRRPIVGMAVTPTGKGYWLVASDGGIFTFGDAAFRGSAANLALSAPVVAMASTHDGRGYWLAGRDGAVYAFGSASFLGSAQIAVEPPVTAIAASASGAGYLVMGRFGEVAAFGDAPRCNVYTRGRNIPSGSGSTKTIGIAIPYDAATLGSFLAGTCGRLTQAFHATSPWHIDITRSAHGPPSFPLCEVVLYRAHLSTSGASALLDVVDAEAPGRFEVRSTQMGGATSFRISAGSCLAIARPGTGGTQSLPFGNLAGGDSLPFTSATPITIDTPRTKAFCRLRVYRDDDGSLVYNHNGTQSHVVIPAGSYFVRSEALCAVHVK